MTAKSANPVVSRRLRPILFSGNRDTAASPVAPLSREEGQNPRLFEGKEGHAAQAQLTQASHGGHGSLLVGDEHPLHAIAQELPPGGLPPRP